MVDTDLNSLRVLVIDDETFMRQLIARLVFEIGVKDIEMADDGSQAIDMVLKARQPYDLVICDLDMPIMNGFDFVRYLRTKSPDPHRQTPVLILTGHSSTENLQEAVTLGINGFVVKPVSRQKLETHMLAALNRPPIDPRFLADR